MSRKVKINAKGEELIVINDVIPGRDDDMTLVTSQQTSDQTIRDMKDIHSDGTFLTCQDGEFSQLKVNLVSFLGL